MMTPEEAARRLETLKDPSWREAALKRAAALPDGPRTVAEAFLEPYDYEKYREYHERKLAAGRSLDALGPGDQAEVTAALHPGLGTALARWWTDARTRPYQEGWARRAFRVTSGEPGPTAEQRSRGLLALVEAAGPFDADPAWLAVWGGHLLGHRSPRYLAPETAGGLLASAVDLGGPAGDEVFRTLLETGNGEHPVAVMDRHVIHALLGSARREGWELAGRLLLAAQRQEGLRQVILEAADEGHPDAFAYLLGVVLDHNLLRFPAAVRAAGAWTGSGETVEDLPRVRHQVRRLAACYGSAAERDLALAGDDAGEVRTALTAGGMRDVTATLDDLRRLAAHPRPDLRTVALGYAGAIGLPAGEEVLAAALDDPDVSVAREAASLLPWAALARPGVFDALARLVPRLPARDQAGAADRLVPALGDQPATGLLPWLPAMSAAGRHAATVRIAEEKAPAPALRAALFTLLRDRSSSVRDTALGALARQTVTPDEAPAVEALLTRAAAGPRRAALAMLADQPVAAAKASAARLAASKSKRQREAAAELRRELGYGSGPAEDLRQTLPGPRTEPLPPRAVPFSPDAGRAAAIVTAIDAIAHEHRDTTVAAGGWRGAPEMLLGDVRYLPGPFDGHRDDGGGMVLGETFRAWWEERPDALRSGDDGRDALGASIAARGPGPLRYPAVVYHVLDWLIAGHLTGAVLDDCLDRYEAKLAAVPADRLAPPPSPGDQETAWRRGRLPDGDWRNDLHWRRPHLLGQALRAQPGLFTTAQLARWHRLERWVEKPHPDSVRLPVDETLLAVAHQAGAATDGDAVTAFLDPRSRLFRDLTRRWRSAAEKEHPGLAPLADQVRARLLETELGRGDLPTPTSGAARNIGGVPGTGTLAALLARLGDAPLARSESWGEDGESRPSVFSHLIRVSFPAPGETGQTLRAAADAEGVGDARLVDLALYAPQWAAAVEQALDWPGLADGVLWLHAHTKDTQWSVDPELRESWAAMIAERTPLSGEDLVNGAVDVAWFRRAREALGADRWQALHQAAKYTAGGTGHRRAQLFAGAMLGETAEDELTARITGKRHQDAVRALGLLPLPPGAGDRDETLARRYALLREFERGSRAFGSQRRASEGAAVRIGIENLARTTGYADPRRFTWAVEAAEAGDLADGPVTAVAAAGPAGSAAGEVTVTLSVTAEGTPSLAVRRGGRTLKAVPAAVKKDPAIAALTARKTALARQARRIRDALQDAMAAQDTFTAADFEALARHPVVAPVLARLVWTSADGTTLMRPDARDLAAKAVGGPLRIAHPADMAADGTWVHWQERLFKKELRQPFKQVFRELYALTGAERAAGPASRRYEGHQVQPRQALALLGGRGWTVSHESGGASKAFHRHGYVARLTFTDGFGTPSEADLPTISGVHFTRPGGWEAQPLDTVPPVVFSETMRDIDLIVSVAHAGGVDPEATASTVGMRAALVRETARLLRLENLRFAGDHVLIDGTLGEYSLHLGSGTVHRRPGGALCIIAVGSQHRGRLFLPFADDDPKTAEVMSKVLLLARDHQIKDPTILEQLRS